MINLVTIRAIQFARIIKQLGWLYSIVLVAVAAFFITILFEGKESLAKAYIVAGVGVLLPIGIHISRGDKLFLYGISDKPYKIYFIEYFFVGLLPIVFLLVKQYYTLSILLIFPPIILGILPIGFFTKNRRKVFSYWPVNPKDFEWISGLRRSFPILAFIYMLSIVSLSVPFLSLLFTWYLALSLCSFYKESESLKMLLANEKTVDTFLISKVMAHQKNYWKFTLPVVFAYTIIHQEHLIIVLLFCIFVFLGLSFAVVNKYSNYEPESYSGNDLLNTLLFGSVLIPFLAPLPIIMLLRSIIKARKNLKYYLGD